MSPLAPFAEKEYVYCNNDPVNLVDVTGLVGEALVETLNERNNILLGPGDENKGLDPDTASLLLEGINEGSACVLELSVTTPDDIIYGGILYEVLKKFNVFKKLLKKIPAIGSNTVDDLINSSTKLPSTKGPSRLYQRSGGYNTALDDFNSLNLTNVHPINNGYTGKLPNGDQVVVRNFSKGTPSSSGAPTLEIMSSTSNKRVKFRY